MVVDKKKDILLYLRDVILSSASIGLLLQVSKTDSISGIEWVSNVGSAPIFLLACLQISSIPSLIRLRPYKSDIKYNHKEITELEQQLEDEKLSKYLNSLYMAFIMTKDLNLFLEFLFQIN